MDNPLKAYPGYLLRRAASARLAELARHLEPLAVGVTEGSILTVIQRNPGISQAGCGRLLSMQRPNLNPIMRRLIDRGLVQATPGAGRIQNLTLTPAGAALEKSIVREFEAHEERIFAAVPPHLRDELVPMLLTLVGPET
jgi:DNA-binding MarR family transcriptional regulator